MAPMRREPFGGAEVFRGGGDPFALAAPSASGAGALAPRFSRDLRANFMGSRICFPGTSPLLPKGAHSSRGTPLSLGWRAVSLPQAFGGQPRLTGLLRLFRV
jgi:hypothetical protein